ncbi:DMT family transporter [Cryomorphaceae bacterium 1068]|nr:DMT family transporter [Cryomorphaceae bacterium 1068]
MNPRTLAHLAALGVALIYGANYVIAKDVMPLYIEPRGFILLRVAGATTLFFILSLFIKSDQKIERKDWLRLILCGFFGVAANQLFFFEGLNLTTPINASVIMTANPIMVLFMSAVLLKEKLKPIKLLGIVIGAVGAVYLILSAAGEGYALPGVSLGNLFVFMNAASYGVYLVIVKPLLIKYDALLVIKWVFAAGLCFVLPVGLSQFGKIDLTSWTPSIFGAVTYVVICTTFLAYLLNVFALRTLKSSTVSTYIYLQPLFATLLALYLAKDALTFETTISAAFIFIGVYLVGRKPKTAEVAK